MWKFILCSLLITRAVAQNIITPDLVASWGVAASSVNGPPVSGYIIWLDASDGSTLWTNVAGTVPAIDGATAQKFVARWDDKSASGTNDVFMDIPGLNERRPAISNSVVAFNSKPGLIFACRDFTSEERTWLQTATNNVTLGSTGVTVFCVSAKITWPSESGDSFPMMFAHGAAGAKAFEMRVEGATGGSTTNMDVIWNGVTTGPAQGFQIARGYAWAMQGDNTDSGNLKQWRNGLAATPGTLATDMFPQANGFSVGSRWSSAARDNCWHGAIAEVIVYPYALSSLQVSNVNFYLTNKYALHDP